MPLVDYYCENCGTTFERLCRGRVNEFMDCPDCKQVAHLRFYFHPQRGWVV